MNPTSTAPAQGTTAPGRMGWPVVGTALEIKGDILGHYIRLWKEYGDVYRTRLGPMNMYALVRPEHVKHVLLDKKENYPKGSGFDKIRLLLGNGLFVSEGEVWARQRKLMQPLFTPKAIQRFVIDMSDATLDVMKGWDRDYFDSGLPVNITFEMTKLAISVISRTMFGLDLSEHSSRAGVALGHVLKFASERSIRPIDLPLWVPTAENRLFEKSLNTLDELVYGVLKERRSSSNPRDDLLTRLLQAEDETGGKMSDLQVRDEVMTIFLAGHETTAVALAWTWYYLARQPELAAAVTEEARRVLGDGPVRAEHLPQLVYTRMVIDESMRIRPPVWVYPREALKDDVVGGYHIPAGAIVMLLPYLTHHHPDLWENPEVFDPERFREERISKQEKYAYFPFGNGPRVCLGNNFALMEMVVVVATMAQQLRVLEPCTTEIAPVAVGTLRAKEPVRIRLARAAQQAGA